MRDTILTIAGSDSSGGAGIQADLKAIAANGGYGASVVTAITAQNTTGVERAELLSGALVDAQLRSVFSDLRVVSVKSGMLGNAAILGVVAAALRRYSVAAYVCDPVLISKHGQPLLPAECVEMLRSELLPLASLVTPNIHEASVLAGCAIATVADAEFAGRKILELGAKAVLVKGGHLAAAPGTDLLVTRSGVERFPGEWIDSANTHGTGCTLSAAIATSLGLGRTLSDSVARAKQFISEAIRAGESVGKGGGPTDAFFFLRSEAAASGWVQFLGDAGTAQVAERPGALLHVITDELVQTRYSHAELARQAAEGGADVIQFREKRPWTTSELVRAAASVARAIEGSGARLVVNDRADVAAAVGAAGVHLGPHDLSLAVARRLLGCSALLGATANSLADAARAAAQAPAYVGAGPVFGSRTKSNPGPELGLEGLRSIVNAVTVPVVAIGSVMPDRVAEIMATGVAGIAVASAVACDRDPAAATRRLREALAACARNSVRTALRGVEKGPDHATR